MKGEYRMNNNKKKNTITPAAYDFTNHPATKKKKRIKARWVFLILLLLVGVIIGLRLWRNKAATDLLEQKLGNQPFTFSGMDYCDYVTADIGFPTEIELNNGKTAAVEWHSENENILSAEGTVHRPKRENTVVTLTATLKHGLGKGKVNYDMTVITEKPVDEANVFVLKQEDIENGFCDHKITIGYDDANNIRSITGNFGATKVSSVEDALYVIDQYRSVLGFDETMGFVGKDVNTNLTGKTFCLQQMVNDVPVLGGSVVLNTNASDHLTSMHLFAQRNIQVDTSVTLTEAELDAIADAHLGGDAQIYHISRMVYLHEERPYLAYSFVAVGGDEEKGGAYTMIADAHSRTILSQTDVSETMRMYIEEEFTGVDGYGNEVSFFAAFSHSDDLYTMYDNRRGILMTDGSLPIWSPLEMYLLKNIENAYEVLIGLHAYEHPITNYGKRWYNPMAVSALINLQTTYDWYEKTLDFESIDGKGQILCCMVNITGLPDNAFFFPGYIDAFGDLDASEMFLCGPAKDIFTYAPCSALDTMAHEYTHGVFHHLANRSGKTGVNIKSIDEGYADVFGCLIEGNWIMGETIAPVPVRDPTGTIENLLLGYKYPTSYMGRNWSNDGHINGILLSRAAYLMSQNGFTNEDIAKIWFQSMYYGYDNESDFRDVRYHVECAARDLGCSKEQLITIGDIFGKMRIGEIYTKELRSNAVEGDILLDDTEQKRIVQVCSPFAALLGAPYYIFEEETDMEPTLTDEQVSQRVSYYASYIASSEDDSLFYNPLPEFQYQIDVRYRHISKAKMDVLYNMVKIYEKTTSAIPWFSEEETKEIMDYSARFEGYTTTSNDFWFNRAGIEYALYKQMEDAGEFD